MVSGQLGKYIYFALTVHTDPDDLPSFADECSFGNWSSDSYH